MLDNITFVDLVALTRITPDSTVEKFGGLINSSFFDASNILGTLKQRGLIDFVTSFPTQSAITLTDQGKQLISEAQERSSSPFDTLDMEVLVQLSNGNRNLQDLNSEVNVTSKDLAIHLYKLSQQQFISYELRNGNMTMTLTEKGFLRVREGSPKAGLQQSSQPMQDLAEETQPKIETPMETPHVDALSMNQPLPGAQQPTDATSKLTQPGAQPSKPKTPDELHEIESKIVKAKKRRVMLTLAMVVVVVIAVVVMYSLHLI